MMHERCTGCNNNRKGRCTIVGAPTENIASVKDCKGYVTGKKEEGDAW